MSDYRFKKAYPRDATRPTIQRNWNSNLRLAQITSVDTAKGTCCISYLDRIGGRNDVFITQGNPNDFVIPPKGSVVIVGFDAADQVRILGYINHEYLNKVKKQQVPKLQEGDKFEEAGNSYTWTKKNGEIQHNVADKIITTFGIDGTKSVETVNLKETTEANTVYKGIVKRYKVTSSSYESIYDTDPTEPYVEIRGKIFETADSIPGFSESAEALIDYLVGTDVNKEGFVINKNGVITTLFPSKAVMVKVEFKNGNTLIVDKEGIISLQVKSLNINKAEVDIDNPDVSMGLEEPSTKGTKGMHVAREHDKVTIPLSPVYTDDQHTGLTNKSTLNLKTLQLLASAFISPAGPCVLNPTVLQGNIQLEGEITEGASNVYIGDK